MNHYAALDIAPSEYLSSSTVLARAFLSSAFLLTMPHGNFATAVRFYQHIPKGSKVKIWSTILIIGLATVSAVMGTFFDQLAFKYMSAISTILGALLTIWLVSCRLSEDVDLLHVPSQALDIRAPAVPSISLR
jgi:hypothetical protein